MRGDSGSWVFKGEDVQGVVTASSTEASGEHFAYTISMTDVCRNISIGMGNASVHIPTPIENTITKHNVANEGRDTPELAALYIKQMLQEVARNGRHPMEPRLSDGASPCSSNTNALLTLARICPPVKPFNIPGPRFLESLSLTLRLVMSRNSIWHELRQYNEFYNFAGLVTIFCSIDRNIYDHEAAGLIQLTMTELGIFPQPSKKKLGPLVRQLRSQSLLKHVYCWISITDDAPPHLIFPFREDQDNLRAGAPKLLARMFYAANARKFFVYCGPWARWLHCLSRIVELRVLMIDTDFDHSTLELQAHGEEHWASQIQVFVIPESQLGHYSKNNSARFGTYGDVVEHHELRDLLWRLANSSQGYSESVAEMSL